MNQCCILWPKSFDKQTFSSCTWLGILGEITRFTVHFAGVSKSFIFHPICNTIHIGIDFTPISSKLLVQISWDFKISFESRFWSFPWHRIFLCHLCTFQSKHWFTWRAHLYLTCRYSEFWLYHISHWNILTLRYTTTALCLKCILSEMPKLMTSSVNYSYPDVPDVPSYFK